MNQTTWVRASNKLHQSQETASNGKPLYKLEKCPFAHYWQLKVWDDARNKYRCSQFTAYKLPEIKKFFSVCDLILVGLHLDEIGA